MRVVLRVEAKQDLRGSSFFYESQHAGLGDRFLDYIDEQLDALEREGGMHSKISGFHCKSLRRFPFAIYYLVNGNVVDVVAIIDQRRHPLGISNRLRKSQLDEGGST